MLLYEVYMKHSCRYVVAVNLDKHLHFTVACDGTESVNVTCSRGELYSEDCIPPRHRQVYIVYICILHSLYPAQTCVYNNRHKKL